MCIRDSLQVALRESGYVGKTNALPDVVKAVNRELRGGEAAAYRVPDSVPGVAQALLQYQSSHRPQDLWHFVTPDYRETSLWVQLTSGDNRDMEKVIAAVDTFVASNPAPAAVQAKWFGLTYVNVIWQEKMVSGMTDAFAGSFAVVLAMMVFLFRSPVSYTHLRAHET